MNTLKLKPSGVVRDGPIGPPTGERTSKEEGLAVSGPVTRLVAHSPLNVRKVFPSPFRTVPTEQVFVVTQRLVTRLIPSLQSVVSTTRLP